MADKPPETTAGQSVVPLFGNASSITRKLAMPDTGQIREELAELREVAPQELHACGDVVPLGRFITWTIHH
jgi:hypothetical protein